jgi:hypothetical protein
MLPPGSMCAHVPGALVRTDTAHRTPSLGGVALTAPAARPRLMSFTKVFAFQFPGLPPPIAAKAGRSVTHPSAVSAGRTHPEPPEVFQANEITSGHALLISQDDRCLDAACFKMRHASRCGMLQGEVKSAVADVRQVSRNGRIRCSFVRRQHHSELINDVVRHVVASRVLILVRPQIEH